MTDYSEEILRAIAKLEAEGKVRVIGEMVIHQDAPDEAVSEAFEGMGLVFAFPDQSQSFTCGFEAGMIWQRIEAGEAVIDKGFTEGFPAREDNIELIARMARAGGYTMETHPTGYDGWISVRLSFASKPKPALRVVL